MIVFHDSINCFNGFHLLRSWAAEVDAKVFGRTTDSKKEEVEAGHTEMSDLRSVSRCENIKSLSWKKEVEEKQPN